MEGKYLVTDIRQALLERLYPTITLWNRIEGRPRKDNFDRALKAEVRDALWMLTKQWQIGEFEGDDAGWPVFAKIHMNTAQVTKYKPANGNVEAFQPSIPLEAKVEQMPVSLRWDEKNIHLDLRLQMGRQWRKLLGSNGFGGYIDQYLTRYPFALPPQDEQSAYVYAHREAWQQYAAIADRCIDGGQLYLALIGSPPQVASQGITLAIATDGPALDALGQQFVQWFQSLYYQPTQPGTSAWKPSSLEYGFACSTPRGEQEKVLTADEYYHGHLDWYSFDHDSASEGLGATRDALPNTETIFTYSFIPAPVEFEGMPDTRWWALEDRKTDFGNVKPSTTDLAQLLLVEFGLVYANDWFLVPFRLPVGTLADIEGMVVTNTFGERFWIEAAGRGADEDWHRWSMFTLNIKGNQDVPANTSLFLPPVSAKVQEGNPQEEVQFVRDEMANMVWAIETTIPLVNGYGRLGSNSAQETLQYHQRLIGSLPPTPTDDYQASISYLAMTTVPENWIPFVPVHVEGSNREVQLQRSRILRTIEGDPLPPDKIPPRTTLVGEGLDEIEKKPYFVHEEEVPRAGIRVTKTFQRTRGTNGEAYVWLGIRKQTGRGERTSGLAFDTIINAKRED